MTAIADWKDPNMHLRRWPQTPPPDFVSGSVVHGPVVVVDSATAVVEIRSITAHPDGLRVALTGSGRRTPVDQQPLSAWEAAVAALQETGSEDAPDPLADLRLLVTVDGIYGPAAFWEAEVTHDEVGFTFHASFWIDRVPRDQRVTLHLSWPPQKLSEVATTLDLTDPGGSAGG